MKIGLSLTNSCNFQCRHCLVNSTLKLNITSDDVINRFYEIVEYNKPDTICIVGGEPLLFIDKVEEIVNKVRKYCKEIIVFSNWTFLLDKNKRERVEKLGIQVRISKTEYHKQFWNDEIQSLIDNSPYWKIEGLGRDIAVFPRGRALKNNIYKNYKCHCSLVRNEYDNFYYTQRFLIMQDGSVNIWCPCLPLELAHVFIDKIITYDLLINRECKLREYLKEVNMFKEDMLFMCNKVCNTYRVTKYGIYKENKIIKKF